MELHAIEPKDRRESETENGKETKIVIVVVVEMLAIVLFFFIKN